MCSKESAFWDEKIVLLENLRPVLLITVLRAEHDFPVQLSENKFYCNGSTGNCLFPRAQLTKMWIRVRVLCEKPPCTHLIEILCADQMLPQTWILRWNFRVIKMSSCSRDSPENPSSAWSWVRLAWLGQLGVPDHIHKKDKLRCTVYEDIVFKKNPKLSLS